MASREHVTLFLEQVVKGAPCIFDRVGTGRSLALHAFTQGKLRAIIVQIKRHCPCQSQRLPFQPRGN